jgi:hypothetical protein
MTTPSSGPISISQINAEFGLGNNLGAYKGIKYYTPTNRRGYFASGSNAYLNASDFYNIRSTSPVTPSSTPWVRSSNGTYTFTVPMFNILTVTVVGARGGQAGSNGYYFNGDDSGKVANYGTSGGPGGKSSFGIYASASGGPGGVTSGAGGTFGDSKTIVLNVDNNSEYFNLYNTNISAVVGNGGGHGTGGLNKLWVDATLTSNGYYKDWYKSSDNSDGSDGSVTISWT